MATASTYKTLNFQFSESQNIRYYDSGNNSKKTILFVHGLGSSGRVWQPLINELSHEYRCIAPDLPGHGFSSAPHKACCSPLYYSQILHSLATHLNLSGLYLVGHSMGGQTAILFSLRYPHLPVKLILISPAGFETFMESEKSMLLQSIKGGLQMDHFRTVWEGNFGMNASRVDDIRQSEKSIERNVVLNVVRGMLDSPVLEALSQLNLPVKVIFGARDNFIPNSFIHPRLTTTQIAEQGTSRIREAELTILPKANHFPHVEEPVLVASLVRQFVQ